MGRQRWGDRGRQRWGDRGRQRWVDRDIPMSSVHNIKQSSILVNKLQKKKGRERESWNRKKTQINYRYLLNETTLIRVSRSGGEQGDLLSSSNSVGISLIRKEMES
jgi:hypothetical protein